MLSAGNNAFGGSPDPQNNIMWLLNATSRKLELFRGKQKPKYAVLFHLWERGEISFSDLSHVPNTTATDRKVDMSCRLALAWSIEYIWIDTCCVNRFSRTEQAVAIGNMDKYFTEAEVCFAYLKHWPALQVDQLGSWSNGGWAYQEVLLSKSVELYDRNWVRIGTSRKPSLPMSPGNPQGDAGSSHP